MLVMLLVASAATPKADFDRCVSVLQKRPSYAASATATTTARGVTVVTSATIAVRSKNWVTIDVSTPAELGHGALDWICEVHNRALRAYDSKRHAYIEQTFNDPLPAAQGLVAQFGAMIPDPIQRLMSPQNLQGFFDRFLVLKGWQQSSPGESIVWRCKNKVGSVEFDFDRSSGRLTKWQIHGTSMTTWKLKYPSLSSISPLRIPADSVLVETLRLPAPRPKITDPRASKTVASCFDAYDKAFRFSCTVRVDGVPTRIWRDGGMVEQVGPTGGWRWSRGILTVWPKGHGVISGRTRLSKVRSYLGELNVDAEPLALAVLADDNFASKLFTPDYNVKQVGVVTLQGVPLILLQLAGTALRIDLSIDPKGLIRRIDSSAYDGSGSRISETVREFSFKPPGTPVSPPAGKAASLPKLKPPPAPVPGMSD